MGENSKIEWTDHTFNAWIGCSKVSPACDHCYAEAMAKRAGWDVWGDDKPRKSLRAEYWKQPHKWNRTALESGQRARVFCSSLADVFEDRRDLDVWRENLWGVIEETPKLDWLLLTKRPQNMTWLAPKRWANRWPANVWAGTTCEDQARADERIPYLLRVPATVRFLSVEPMLGPVDLVDAVGRAMLDLDMFDGGDLGIHWVIVGGESGPGARPFALEWARSIVAQCKSAGVSVFVKQLGSKPTDGSLVRLRNRKGGDMTEFPEELRVREFPR